MKRVVLAFSSLLAALLINSALFAAIAALNRPAASPEDAEPRGRIAFRSSPPPPELLAEPPPPEEPPPEPEALDLPEPETPMLEPDAPPPAPLPLSLDLAAPGMAKLELTSPPGVTTAPIAQASRQAIHRPQSLSNSSPSEPAEAESVEQPPRPLAGNRQPSYPRRAQRRQLKGEVSVRILVSAEGAMARLQVLSASSELFAEAVQDVASAWRFEPARSRGQPLACWVRKTFYFEP
jgi:protein TonB